MADPNNAPPADPFDQFDAQAAAASAQPQSAPVVKPVALQAQAPDSGLKRDLELGGGAALAGTAAIAAARYPVLRDALEKLRSYVAEHPIVGRTLLGGTLGAAAGTPQAIRTGHPADIAVGAGAGSLGGLALPTAARAIPAALLRLKLNAPERHTAGAMLGDFGRADAAANRLRQLATQMRSGARAAVPSGQTVGEVLGPQGSALADAAIAQPAKESQAYMQQLQNRNAAAPDRARALIDQSLAPTDYPTADKQLTQALKQNAAPLYDQAFKQFPSVKSDVFTNDVLGSPTGADAVKAAAERWQEIHKAMPIGPVGPGGMTQAPALEFHQLVREELDDQISRLKKGVNNGTVRRKDLNAVRNLRNNYVNDLNGATGGDASPYKAAAAQYSTDAATLDALHDARDSFLKMTPQEVKDYMGGLDFSQRDAFRSGAAESMFRNLGKTSAASNPFFKLSGAPDVREKVSSLFENPKDANNFLGALDRESSMLARSRQMIAAGQKGPAAAVESKPNLLGRVLKSATHSINPHLAATRAGIDEVTRSPVPAAGISRIMSQSGNAGASQLDRLRQAVGTLERMRNAQNTAGLLGTVAGGTGAGAMGAHLDRSQPDVQ